MFEVKGKIHVLFDTQQVTERFMKREFVLEITNGQFSEYVKFQLTQQRCSLLDTCSVGDEIKVRFALKGKPYQKGSETLYFTNLEAINVEAEKSTHHQPHDYDVPPPPQEDFFDVNDSPLPF